MATVTKRVGRNGDTSYRVQVRLRGFPEERASFKRKTDALIWAQQTETAMREGRYFKSAEAKRHTVAELVERYQSQVLDSRKPAQASSGKQQLGWWKRRIGHLVLSDVTPSVIAECRDELLGEVLKQTGKRRKPATVARYLATFSHALSVAVSEWEWLDQNPMQKVRKPSLPRGRVRFLSDDERGRLLDACKRSESPYLHIVVVLALSTGMRKSEVLGLRWPDLDLTKGRAILHETKNGERRTVPILGQALDMLRHHAKLRRLDTDLLFPSRRNPVKPVDLRKPWETAVTRAKLEDFRFHDLRHSAASYLAMSGASMPEIGEILGHKTLQMVKRYTHLSEGHTADVVGRMNQKYFGYY